MYFGVFCDTAEMLAVIIRLSKHVFGQKQRRVLILRCEIWIRQSVLKP